MIWAAIATILVIAILLVLLPSFWFWVSWEVIAGAMVAIGCGFEWYLLGHEPEDGMDSLIKQRHRKKEMQFALLVAMGVTMEFIALAHTVPEGLKLEERVNIAEERAADADSNRLVLAASLLALETKAQDRHVTLSQRETFKNLLKNTPKCLLKTGSRRPNRETQAFASEVISLLNDAGFTIFGENHSWAKGTRIQIKALPAG